MVFFLIQKYVIIEEKYFLKYLIIKITIRYNFTWKFFITIKFYSYCGIENFIIVSSGNKIK